MARNRQGRFVPAIAPVDLSSHLSQRFGNPRHGAPPQGAISIEHEMTPVATSQEAEHQSHRGAGIAAIEHLGWFLQAIKAHALDADDTAAVNR